MHRQKQTHISVLSWIASLATDGEQIAKWQQFLGENDSRPPACFPGIAAVQAPVHHAPNSETNIEELKAGRGPSADDSNTAMYS